MSTDNTKESKRLKSITIHEARLRKLIQFLKEKEALVTIDYDPYGDPKTTKYSSSKETANSLKELIISIWPEATANAYYEYLKTDYEAHRKTTVKAKHHPSYEKFIKDIQCTFKLNAKLDNTSHKEQLFFSGARPEQTNILAAFPNYRRDIIKDIKQFVSLLETQEEGFPYQQLRNLTSHRCHRFKDIEKDLFQYFKDANSTTLQSVRSNFAETMSSFITHLEKLEREEVGHGNPDGVNIVENRLRYSELSKPMNIDLKPEEKQKIESIGFQDAFSDKNSWFDELRFKKITYWKNKLKNLEISDWPPYYLEHILLAYFELNTVCAKIVMLRDQLFDQVGFYISYSKDGQERFSMDERLSPEALSTLLSNYEYKSNDFVDALRSDGNLLQGAIQKLNPVFDKISSPDNLFYSRIKKLIWEYLLFRMCDSCQIKREHVSALYTPLYTAHKK